MEPNSISLQNCAIYAPDCKRYVDSVDIRNSIFKCMFYVSLIKTSNGWMNSSSRRNAQGPYSRLDRNQSYSKVSSDAELRSRPFQWTPSNYPAGVNISCSLKAVTHFIFLNYSLFLTRS